MLPIDASPPAKMQAGNRFKAYDSDAL